MSDIGDEQQPVNNGTTLQQAPPPSNNDGKIVTPAHIWKLVIIPALVVVLVIVLISAPEGGRVDLCDRHSLLIVVYPILFGVIGILLGGTATVVGQLPLFGNMLTTSVGGGIAAAVLGLAIASYSKPDVCQPRHSFILNNYIPEGALIVGKEKDSIIPQYTSQYVWQQSSDADIIIRRSERNQRDLEIRLMNDRPVRLSFDVLKHNRRDKGLQDQSPLVTCKLDILIGRPADKLNAIELYKNGSQYELSFPKNFFTSFENEASRNSGNENCFSGQYASADGVSEKVLTGEIYIEPRTQWPISLFSERKVTFLSPKAPQSVPAVAKDQVAIATAEASEPVKSADPPLVPAKPTPAIKISPPVISTNCKPDAEFSALIDRFISGEELDGPSRKKLYANWASLHCYTWPFVGRAGVDPVAQARALRLVTYAIFNKSESEGDRGYWQPQGDNKRNFAIELPYLSPEDHRTIFELLKSENTSLRDEAMRAIRALPVDRFEKLISESRRPAAPAGFAEQERLAICAAYLYYNRIVEWLDDKSTAKEAKDAIARAINAEFSAAQKWITKPVLGDAENSFSALLWYARAIVEYDRELTQDNGRASFFAMIRSVENLQQGYPSSFRHIAQAVAITRTPNKEEARTILKDVRDAEALSSATAASSDIKFADRKLFAGPSDKYRQDTANSVDPATAKLLLNKGDWYLASGSGWVGWLRRQAKS